MDEQKLAWKPTVGWSRAYVVICILYTIGVIVGAIGEYKYSLPSLDDIKADIPKHLKDRVHYRGSRQPHDTISTIDGLFFKNKNGTLQQTFPVHLKDCPTSRGPKWEDWKIIVYITRDATLDPVDFAKLDKTQDSFYKLVEDNYKKVKLKKLKEFWMAFIALLFMPPILLYISGRTIYWVWQGFTHKEELK